MERLLHSSIDHSAHNKYDLGYCHDTTIFLDESGRTISSIRVVLVTISSSMIFFTFFFGDTDL